MDKNSKKIDLLIELFMDSIKYATSKTNLSIKLSSADIANQTRVLIFFRVINVLIGLRKYQTLS